MTAIVGTAEHYGQFLRLCRERIEELGVPYETIDRICGFPERYTSNLLTGGKAMSVYSFFTIAQALALDVCFVHDAEELAKLATRSNWVKRRAKKKKRAAIAFYNDADFYRKIGHLGGSKWATLRRKRKAQTAAATAARMAKWRTSQLSSS